MERVGTILKPVFSHLSLEEKVALDRLRRDWPRLFGEPLSRHTFPADLDKGVLVIAVDTPGWLQQLRFFTSDMLEKLSSFGIGALRFRLGRVSHRRSGGGKDQADQAAADRKPEPSESELRWIDETLGPIEDEEIKEALRRALRKSLPTLTGR